MAMHFAGTPVSCMANVHCARATLNFLALENHSLDVPWWSDMVEGVEKPIVNHGFITVPDKPGLGITLNEDVVKAHLLPGTSYFRPRPSGTTWIPRIGCGVRRDQSHSDAPKPKYITGLIQMSCSPSPDENLQKAVALVEDAAQRGAEVICLPELFRSQYFCQREDIGLFDLAETVPGPTTETLGKVAKSTRKWLLLRPCFERRAAGVYHNSAVVIDASGEVVGLYRKMHIPGRSRYYEKFYFTPGDLGFRCLQHASGPHRDPDLLGSMVPEGARLTALQGPSILFYPTAIGWHPAEKVQFGPSQRDAWANHPARPRHRQWGVRRCGQSRGL